MHIAQTPILYTVQRNALFSNIKVRLGSPDDEERIHIFLADIMQAEAHAADVMIAMEMNHKHRVYPYVIMAEDMVIGICILLWAKIPEKNKQRAYLSASSSFSVISF